MGKEDVQSFMSYFGDFDMIGRRLPIKGNFRSREALRKEAFKHYALCVDGKSPTVLKRGLSDSDHPLPARKIHINSVLNGHSIVKQFLEKTNLKKHVHNF